MTAQMVHTLDGEPIESSDDMAGTTAGGAKLTAAREAIESAVDGDADPDGAAKRALGEIAAYYATRGDPVRGLAEARVQLEAVLGADDEEKQHFAKEVLRLLK